MYYFVTYFFDLILFSLRELFYILKDIVKNIFSVNEDIIFLKSLKTYVEYSIILIFIFILILFVFKLFKNKKNISLNSLIQKKK